VINEFNEFVAALSLWQFKVSWSYWR